MGLLFKAYNAAAPTTAQITPVTTGTAIQTMLQIATPSTKAIKVKSWGISFAGSAAGQGIGCELIQTDVAATVTAHVAAGVFPFDNASGEASLMTLGTSATGYTASAEGSITATRLGDFRQIQPTNDWSYDFVLGQEFHVPVSKFLRVRVKAAVAVSAVCWCVWEE